MITPPIVHSPLRDMSLYTSSVECQPTEIILHITKKPQITLTRSRSSSNTLIDSNFLWAIISFLSSIPIFSAISSSSVNPIFLSLLAFLFSSLEDVLKSNSCVRNNSKRITSPSFSVLPRELWPSSFPFFPSLLHPSFVYNKQDKNI